MDLITPPLVVLDTSLGTDKEAVIRALAARVADAGRSSDSDQIATDALAREATSATGLPGGIAIPHCRTTGVDDATLAFARLDPPVDFGAKDGPAELIFLITAPAGGDDTHLQLLTKLARSLVKKEFTDGLRAARTPDEVVERVNAALGTAPASAPAAAAAPAAAPAGPAAAPPPAVQATQAATAGSASAALIISELVFLDASLGDDKEAVIRALAKGVGDGGRSSDSDQIATDALAREATSATGLPGGIAIPHCRTTGVDDATLAFARLDPPVDFGAKDGAADLVFLITAPAGGDDTHLQLLTKLARSLVKKEFTDGLRAAATPDEVVERVNAALGEAPKIAPAAAPPAAAPAAAASSSGGATSVAESTPAQDAAPPASSDGPKRLVAVTACPTGIAHTYMAAEALEQAAARAGVEIAVETQGSAGSKPLSPDTIAAADAVIFAVDVGVRDRSRFAGKPVVSSGVKRPMDEGDKMIAEALRYAGDPNAPRVEGDVAAGNSGGSSGSESWGASIRRVLMTGVSYMIPFVAAGGLLIALGFLLAGYEIALADVDATGIATGNSLFDLPDAQALGLDHALFGSDLLAYFGALLFVLGGAAFSFLVPALAGYIAYAIADRPGIAPGFVMGAIAGTTSSGFIGGIVGGVLAGVIAHWIAGWGVPAWARGLMPVLVIPLLTTFLAGFVMVVVLGKPLAALTDGLSDGLNSLSGGSAVILGVILGLMMAFDMGGPLNKTAYAFATTGLAAAATSTDAPELKIMAAVMLAGMVPPLGLALASVLRPGLFSAPERENGKAGWLLGASFITEGAIPFAAADPLRVIPAIMAGSAVTGGLSQLFGVQLRAPHGGIFVLFAVDGVVGFLISLVAGVVVAAAAVIVLKSMGDRAGDREVEREAVAA